MSYCRIDGDLHYRAKRLFKRNKEYCLTKELLSFFNLDLHQPSYIYIILIYNIVLEMQNKIPIARCQERIDLITFQELSNS